MHGNNLWPNKSSLVYLYFHVEELYWLCFQPLLTFYYNCLDDLWEWSFNLIITGNWKLPFITRNLSLSLSLPLFFLKQRGGFFPASKEVSLIFQKCSSPSLQLTWPSASGYALGVGPDGWPWGLCLFQDWLWEYQQCSNGNTHIQVILHSCQSLSSAEAEGTTL